jgi:hypothetical protein
MAQLIVLLVVFFRPPSTTNGFDFAVTQFTRVLCGFFLSAAALLFAFFTKKLWHPQHRFAIGFVGSSIAWVFLLLLASVAV